MVEDGPTLSILAAILREEGRRAVLAAGARATTSMAEFFGMCASGDLAGVQAALNADPALSGALDQNLWSGVHHATKHGHTEVLEALLGACAAVLHDANANLNTGPNTHPTSIMARRWRGRRRPDAPR